MGYNFQVKGDVLKVHKEVPNTRGLTENEVD